MVGRVVARRVVWRRDLKSRRLIAFVCLVRRLGRLRGGCRWRGGRVIRRLRQPKGWDDQDWLGLRRHKG